jgi:hypothetical protein
MTRPKRLTVTQLAMELSNAASRYPREEMTLRWSLASSISKEWWRRAARRARELEPGYQRNCGVISNG